MFDFDIFPESSYDPTTGEYVSDFDFEPTPIGTINLQLDETLYARVFSLGDYDEAVRAFHVLADIAARGVFETDYDPKNPHDYPLTDEPFLRRDKRKTRGPFGDEQLDRFFQRTGLRNISEVFYDEELDAFWVEIDTP